MLASLEYSQYRWHMVTCAGVVLPHVAAAAATHGPRIAVNAAAAATLPTGKTPPKGTTPVPGRAASVLRRHGSVIAEPANGVVPVPRAGGRR